MKIKHGDARSNGRYYDLYNVWHNMKQRCYYSKNKNYDRYGGREIKVCDKWKLNYLNFRKWALQNNWVKGLQIDRIDNNGNYEPSNCRFVTSTINVRNSSITKINIQIAEEIRIAYKTGNYTHRELAIKYNFKSHRNVGAIINNKIWKKL